MHLWNRGRKSDMEQKQENPIKLLLSWSGKSKRYLFASVACAFASGLFVIGPYIGIYNLMDAILSENITQRLLVNNIVLISATTILRMITLACSGVLSHKGAYGALSVSYTHLTLPTIYSV